MKTIKTAFTGNYRNGELIQFVDDLLVFVQKRGPIHPKLQVRFDELSTAKIKAAKAFEPSKKLTNTEDIIAFDKQRDELTIGLRTLLLGLTKHPVLTYQEAAKRLLERIDSYGKRIYRLNLQLQTQTTTDLIDALITEPKLNNDITTLQVVRDYINALQKANISFSDMYIQRTQEKGERVEAEMADLITKLEETYRAFVTRLNAILEMDESYQGDHLVNDINAAIDQYNQVVLDRRGKGDSSSETNNQQDTVEEFMA
ncbi:DUF6261 family protein [Aquimarina mytili]|uniref:Uncharacterized protein n=1 Tax=Aquimarina mytili TaxID=874423 RepID=A0A937DDC6_9FLAO|nr:DUF6261 family protein [Aquimarina mytili]MBL0685886.1 hypothetical protein [Aquimarina mytili]